MKKYLAVFLALLMVLSLAACGGNDTPDPSGSENNTPSRSEHSRTIATAIPRTTRIALF